MPDESIPEWRVVPGFKEYEVSSDGRVRRINATLMCPPKYELRIKVVNGKNRGSLTDNARKERFVRLEALVCLAFCGEPLSSEMLVHQADGNKLNNHAANLTWRLRSKPFVELGTCACGCGQRLSSRATTRGSIFKTGHNRQGHRKPVAIITCRNCERKFEVMPYLKDRVFCSNDCRDDLARKSRGPLNPQYKRIERKCGACGEPCLVMPNQAKRGKNSYCSKKCSTKAKSERLRALGKARAKPHCWSYGKRAARIRDNGCCRICGFSVVVHVHHIRPRSQGGGNQVANMITLCPNHHAMAHRKLLTMKYLLSLIAGLPTKIVEPLKESQGKLF